MKMIKYLKKFICLMLLLIMPLESYASISAADGSVFVTKGEFDLAITDLTSRFTTFEAGINSKIDSKVTSYLDRNGIWSGMEQKLMNSNFVWTYGVATGTLLNYKDGKQLKVTKSGFSSLPAIVAGKQYILRDNLFLLVEKVSKSGLCCLNYSVYSNGISLQDTYFSDNSSRRSWHVPITISSSHNSDAIWDSNFYIYHPISFDINTQRQVANSSAKFLAYDIDFFDEKLSGDAPGTLSARGWMFLPSERCGCFYFFVTKNYPLYYTEYLAVQCNANDSAACIKSKAFSCWGNSYVGYRVDIDRVVVY